MLCLQEQQSHNKETPTQQTACNKTILQGGNRHRVISARPTNTRLPLRYSRVRSGPSITARTWLFTAHGPHLFSHSSFSPPFHHATSCPTRHRADAMGSTRRSSDRKRASAALRVEERHDRRGTNAVWAWGSPPWVERAPRKFGWWGAKQVEAKNTPLTISAFNFPQFTHILSRIFFTLTMNPGQED